MKPEVTQEPSSASARSLHERIGLLTLASAPRVPVYSAEVCLDNECVITLSKRVADTVVATVVPLVLLLETTVSVGLATLLGTGISLVVVILLAAVFLVLLSRLHRQVISGRRVIEKGVGCWSGLAYLIAAFVSLVLGPQRSFPFVEWPLAWNVWIISTSSLFVAGALAFQVEATIAKEAHRVEESPPLV